MSREDHWWLIDVPEIDYRTQAASKGEIEEMARSLIAGAIQASEDSFNLDASGVEEMIP